MTTIKSKPQIFGVFKEDRVIERHQIHGDFIKSPMPRTSERSHRLRIMRFACYDALDFGVPFTYLPQDYYENS